MVGINRFQSRRNTKDILVIILLLIIVSFSTFKVKKSVNVNDEQSRVYKKKECPEGFIYMRDRTIRTNNDDTNRNRKIPKVIHLIVESRCLPKEFAISLLKQEAKWNIDHSIRFHDAQSIEQTFRKSAKELKLEFFHPTTFPSLYALYNCQTNPRIKLDMARFLILWEQGGIALDIDQLPLPSFFHFSATNNNKINSTSFIVDDDDECVWEVSGKDETLQAHTRFIACAPHHSTMYVGIARLLSSTNKLTHCTDNWCSYTHGMPTGGLQKDMYMGTVMTFMANDPTREDTDIKSYYKENNNGFLQTKITHIHSDRMNIPDSQLFHPFNNSTNTTSKNNTAISKWVQEAIQLKPLSEENHIKRCQPLDVFDNASMNVDIDSLLKVVGDYYTLTGNTTKDDDIMMGKSVELESKCNDKDLRYVANRYVPGSLDNEANQRKIPKVVHMTSKTQCVTPKFENNIKGWYFDDHSFFMHDDDAVDRFFNRDWPEFPLLQEIVSCIISGAGKADLWRYLILWEYGGIYTDIDNFPTELFEKGNHITKDVDSYFEVERGGFPSQFFMAASPHHPVMYFMVSTTIERLLMVNSIANHITPFVTGPGATKTAIVEQIGGDGYPTEGLYLGVHNRTLNMVGGKGNKLGSYIHRDSIEKGELSKMNMTHFSDKSKLIEKKEHSCYLEIYNKTHTHE